MNAQKINVTCILRDLLLKVKLRNHLLAGNIETINLNTCVNLRT